MRILTWNINSVRLRIDQVLKVANDLGPDIICLQETKTPDEHFPFEPLKQAGYEHIHIHGMKGYNGVAVISKVPFASTDIHHRVGREDCRHIAAQVNSSKLGKPVQIHCLYIPAGGYEPDPVANDKFQHKLDFVDEMAEWFPEHYAPDVPLITLGDLNIAPLENDVWSHKQMLKVVSHTPVEVEKFTNMQNALEWHDAIRHFVPEDEKCFTWWSYRNRDWKASNRGRRLDHIWMTKPLVPHLRSHEVLVEARDWERPSDHVPLLVEVDI